MSAYMQPPVVLILVLEPGRYVGSALDIDGREAVGSVPQIQGNQAIEVMIIHVDYAAYAKLILDTVCAVIDGKDMPKVQTLDTTLSVKDSCYRI